MGLYLTWSETVHPVSNIGYSNIFVYHQTWVVWDFSARFSIAGILFANHVRFLKVF